MISTARLAAAGAAALATTALLATPSLAATQSTRGAQHSAGQSAGAVFVQTDAPSGNAVVVYHRNGDGTLKPRMTVPGSNPRFLEKARGLEADQVFLDLEDACAPLAKPGARREIW